MPDQTKEPQPNSQQIQQHQQYQQYQQMIHMQQMMMHYQQQQQHETQHPSSSDSSHSHSHSQSSVPSQLSSLQLSQLQQLQYQQLQWQYLHQLQHQQSILQGGNEMMGNFDPSLGSTQAAGGAKQKSYQAYGQYSNTNDYYPPGSAPAATTEEDGNNEANASSTMGAQSTRHRYHNDHHQPSVDPKDWNNSLAYASKANPDRYMTHRNYFSNIPPVVNRLPRKPELKELVLKGRDFYTNNRDPRYYNPVLEAGWDNRAQVVKAPITGTIHSPSTRAKMLNEHASASATHLPQLPNVEEAKEAFGHFPVLVDNGSASTRPGSKLLVPFLHCWPPPFRFDYLKKHSRAPLSPFLASQNGYEVPPELYMSPKQRAEMERAQMEQGGNYPTHGYETAAQARPSAHSQDPIERARARANTHTTYWRTGVSDTEDVNGSSSTSHAGAHSQRSLSDRGQIPQPKSSRPEWNGRHHLVPPQPRVGQTTAKKPTSRRDKHQLALQQQQQQQFPQLPPLFMPNGQPLQPPPYFFFNQPNGMIATQPLPPMPYGFDMNPTQQFQPQPPPSQSQSLDQDMQQQQQQQYMQQQYEAQQQYYLQQQQQQQQQQLYDDQQQHQQQQTQLQPQHNQSSSQSQQSQSSSDNSLPSHYQHSYQYQPYQQPPSSTEADSSKSSDPTVTDDPNTDVEPSTVDVSPSDSNSNSTTAQPTTPGLNPNAGSHVKEIYSQLYSDQRDQSNTHPLSTAVNESAPKQPEQSESANQPTTSVAHTEEA